MSAENLRLTDNALLLKDKQILKSDENYHQPQLEKQQNTVELVNMVNNSQNQSTNVTSNTKKQLNKTDVSLKTENSFENKNENITITKQNSHKDDLNNNQGIKLKNSFKRESTVVKIQSNERANNSYLDEEANKRTERILARIKVLFPIGCTVLSVLATVAIIAVSSYYFGTIGKATEGNYCLNDKYCKAQSLLICKNNTCGCGSQYTFDKSTNICILTNATTLKKNNTNEITETTNLLLFPTTAMTSIATTTTCLTNIGSLGSNLTMTSFNGTAFTYNWGVGTLYTDQVYYFTADWYYSIVVKFNESGQVVKVVSLYWAQYLTAYNKTVYVTSNNSLLNMFDIDLNLMKSINLNSAYAIHYNLFLDRLFVNVGSSTQIFDSNLNTISTFSSLLAYAITSYNEFIYTTDSSYIYKLNATSGVILRTYASPCGDLYGLVVDCSGQYLYVSCFNLKKVIVMNINGTLTGRFYNTIGSPNRLTFDYYGQLVAAMQFISGIQVISVSP